MGISSRADRVYQQSYSSQHVTRDWELVMPVRLRAASRGTLKELLSKREWEWEWPRKWGPVIAVIACEWELSIFHANICPTKNELQTVTHFS
jgi:hypothetical protein